ncbi:MAG: DinB family protein [Ignavibacteriales bacterium]|nr:DinB family protein [Ignavibacteriales bacterium]
MPQTKWFERKFDFDSTQNIFPSIVERLKGTPVRLEEKIKSLPPHILTIKLDGSWSIAENIGHLIDLEPLWQTRLEDFINGEKELHPADLQNTKTHNANHNSKPILELLALFRSLRRETVTMLENVEEKIVFRTALHPRLKTPMRLMDSFLFTAEHDDHHLVRITEITKLVQMQKSKRQTN